MDASSKVLRPGIWPDHMIKAYLKKNGIDFNPENIQPASWDIHLGSTIRVAWQPWNIPGAWRVLWPLHRRWPKAFPKFGPERELVSYLLKPGEFALVDSWEWIKIPSNANVFIMLRSSAARNGLVQSWTGGDPGWSGRWTFEFYNNSRWPIPLTRGDSVMQAVYYGMAAVPISLYEGYYQGSTKVVLSKQERSQSI